jgi:hypothetical protein
VEKNNKILLIPETMQGISTSAESKEERSKKKKKKKKKKKYNIEQCLIPFIRSLIKFDIV